MHRMTQRKTTSLLVATMAAICATCMALPANAQMVRQADIDFEASGYRDARRHGPPIDVPRRREPVGRHAGTAIPTPTGPGVYADPGGGRRRGYVQCGGYGDAMGTVIPWRTAAAMAIADTCDARAVATAWAAMAPAAAWWLGLLQHPAGRRLLGKLCASDSRCCLRHLCMFCRGGGCSACQGLKYCGAMASCLLALRRSRICAQRWYDVVGRSGVLGHTSGGQSGVVTTDGVDRDSRPRPGRRQRRRLARRLGFGSPDR